MAIIDLQAKQYDVGVAYTEAQDYSISSNIKDNLSEIKSELFTIWLEGECYND